MKSSIFALAALLGGASACLAQNVNPPGFGNQLDGGGIAPVNQPGFGSQIDPSAFPGGVNQPGFGDPFGLSNPGAFNAGTGFAPGSFVGAPGLGVWPGPGNYVASGHPLSAELDWAAAYSTVLRNQTQAWEDLSRARRNVTSSMRDFELAREQYIHNQDIWNDVYLERLRIGRELRQQEAEERQRKLAAYREAQELLRPDPLDSGELNRETGEITWPTALQEARFAEEREQLEHLLSARARSSANEGEIARKVSVLIRLMELKLKDLIGEVPQQQYTLASNFLDRLRYDSWVAQR